MSKKNLGQEQIASDKKLTDMSIEESEQKAEQAKEATNQEISDDDLDQVAGGFGSPWDSKDKIKPVSSSDSVKGSGAVRKPIGSTMITNKNKNHY